MSNSAGSNYHNQNIDGGNTLPSLGYMDYGTNDDSQTLNYRSWKHKSCQLNSAMPSIHHALWFDYVIIIIKMWHYMLISLLKIWLANIIIIN